MIVIDNDYDDEGDDDNGVELNVLSLSYNE